MGLLSAILTALFLNVASCAYACVEYCPTTGEYTVDKSGCVTEK